MSYFPSQLGFYFAYVTSEATVIWLFRTVALLLALVFCAGILGNYRNFILLRRNYILYRKFPKVELKRHDPVLPFFFGFTGSLALWMSQVPILMKLWWIPLIVDVGSLPFLCYVIVLYSPDLLAKIVNKSRRK